MNLESMRGKSPLLCIRHAYIGIARYKKRDRTGTGARAQISRLSEVNVTPLRKRGNETHAKQSGKAQTPCRTEN